MHPSPQPPLFAYQRYTPPGGFNTTSAPTQPKPVVHWGVIRRLLASSLLAFVALAGCHSSQNAGPQPSAAQNVKVYKLRGKVVSTDAAKGEVTVDHQAIPGFMDAMTMPYKLKDPTILGELHPGDVITADVLVSPDPNADYLLDHIVVVAQARPDLKPAVSYHVPAPGDPVPDFKLRNQDGRPIHLAQFRGKALLVTFIYTRCPSPNFCPWVTRNFSAVDKQLAANPALYGRTHLLCVSFDPEHDTPQRLRAYGASYIGSDAKSAFAHWDFAVPEKPVLLEMAKFFDLGITNEPDSTITHTLSTTLIGPDGKVVHFYPGNEWTPEQLVADTKQLAAGAA
jgi:protein SCO1/2